MYELLEGEVEYAFELLDPPYRANAGIRLKTIDLFCLNYNLESVIIKLRDEYLMLGVLPDTMKIPVNGYRLFLKEVCHVSKN